MANMNSSPILCEPGIKYFLKSSLNESHKFKEKYINFFYNISMLLVFIALLSAILYYRYKGRLSPNEIALKNRRKKEYIVSKVQHLAARKTRNNMVTDLPTLPTLNTF